MDSKITPLYYDYTPIELGEGKIYQSPMEYIAEDAQNQAMTAALYDDMINNQLPEFLANIPYLDKDKYDKLAGEYTTAIDDITRTLSENPYDKNAQRSIAELATRFRKDISPQGELGLMSANKIGMDTWVANNIDYATTDPETYKNMHDKIKDKLLVNTDPNNIVDIISENIVPRPDVYNKEELGFAGDRMTTETNGFKDPATSDESRANAIVEDYFNNEKFRIYLEQHGASNIPIIKDGIINEEHPFAEEAKNIKSSIMSMRYNNRPDKYKSGNGYRRPADIGSSGNSVLTNNIESYVPNIPFKEIHESYKNILAENFDYNDMSNVQFLNQIASKIDVSPEQIDRLYELTGGDFMTFVYNPVNNKGNTISKKEASKILNDKVYDRLDIQFRSIGPFLTGTSETNKTPKRKGDKFVLVDPFSTQKHTYTIIDIKEDITGDDGYSKGIKTIYTLKDEYGLQYQFDYNRVVDKDGRIISVGSHKIQPLFNVGEKFFKLNEAYNDLGKDNEIQRVNVMSWNIENIDNTNGAFLKNLKTLCNSYITGGKDDLKITDRYKTQIGTKKVDGKDVPVYKYHVYPYNTSSYDSKQKISSISIGKGDDLVRIKYDSGFELGIRIGAIDEFCRFMQNNNVSVKKYFDPQFLKFYSYINSMTTANNDAEIYLDDIFNYMTNLGHNNTMRIKITQGYPSLQRKKGDEWESMTSKTQDGENSIFGFYKIYTLIKQNKIS